MGGVFRALFDPPRAPALPPPAPPPPPPPPERREPEQPAAKPKEREKRRRRGLAETIATSPRGVLRLGTFAPLRKRLLGE